LRSLPLRPDVPLDLVPVDMVVNATLAAIPRIAQTGGVRIYQVATGSRNPISLGDLYDLIYRYFVRNPMLDKAGRPIRIQYLRFPSKPQFRLQHRLRSWPLARAEKTLERMTAVPAAGKARRRIAATRAAAAKLYYYGAIYEPYLNMECRFEVDATMALYQSLDADERRALRFDVTQLNWRHYIQNVHIPGIKRYILKLEGHDVVRPECHDAEPFPATIPELLSRTRRFGDKTALQMRRGGEWQRVSYTELAQAAAAVGSRLHALGLQRGDRVVLFSENQPEWGMAYLGAAAHGLVVVPLDAQTWHKEVWAIARHTRAKALLLSESCFKRLSPESVLENENATDPLLLLNVNRRAAPFGLAEYPRSTGGVALSPVGNGRTAAPIAVGGGLTRITDHPILEPAQAPEPDDAASIIFTVKEFFG
jgi:long-chain acyl-CoA synthetase